MKWCWLNDLEVWRLLVILIRVVVEIKDFKCSGFKSEGKEEKKFK